MMTCFKINSKIVFFLCHVYALSFLILFYILYKKLFSRDGKIIFLSRDSPFKEALNPSEPSFPS